MAIGGIINCGANGFRTHGTIAAKKEDLKTTQITNDRFIEQNIFVQNNGNVYLNENEMSHFIFIQVYFGLKLEKIFIMIPHSEL